LLALLALAPAAGRPSTAAAAGGSAEAFWPAVGVTSVQISPNGRWIAASAQVVDGEVVLVQSVETAEMVRLPTSVSIAQVAWESGDTLVHYAESASGKIGLHVSRFELAGGKVKIRNRHVYAPGLLVDPLPAVPEEVLWLAYGTEWTSLHRATIQQLIDYDDLARRDNKMVEFAERVAVVGGPSSDWVVDRDGNPRAAIRHDPKGQSLVAKSDSGPFVTIHRWRHDDESRAISPVGVSSGGDRLIVKAYNGKNTLGLYELDPKERKLGEAIFVHPDYDVTGALTDPFTGELIAATYVAGGEVRFHYFDAYRARFVTKLSEAWRRDSVRIQSGTADRQVFTLVETTATEPGLFSLRGRDGSVRSIGRFAENVDRDELSSVEVFRVDSRDGIEIEAYLTIPRSGAGPTPLVVMPHGGPMGVRDYRLYDPFVQYLASWGFAVLQMNFRGSEGFGLRHASGVKKEWARGIEDDIDAAVEHAMALPSIDESRICIVGVSYGGFSALASVIRHRDRYRCAISINGVSDIPLVADSSDTADSETAMALWEDYVGDLETERERLIAISPAYHVGEVAAPVLAIQGTDDRRVDPDHAHRLALMFELYGKPFEMLEIDGGEHSFDRDEWVIVARSVRRFLSTHLMPGQAFLADPRTSHDR